MALPPPQADPTTQTPGFWNGWYTVTTTLIAAYLAYVVAVLGRIDPNDLIHRQLNHAALITLATAIVLAFNAGCRTSHRRRDEARDAEERAWRAEVLAAIENRRSERSASIDGTTIDLNRGRSTPRPRAEGVYVATASPQVERINAAVEEAAAKIYREVKARLAAEFMSGSQSTLDLLQADGTNGNVRIFPGPGSRSVNGS